MNFDILFIVNAENEYAVRSLSIGCLSLIVFNLLVLRSISPTVDYFTIIDKLFTVVFILAFIILLINTLTLYKAKKVENLTKNQTYAMKPFSEIISKIIAAGGLFKYKP